MFKLRRTGLVILALLALADLATPVITDGQSPPMSVALVVAGLGAVSLSMAALAWSGRNWPAVVLIVIRLLSAVAAVPALYIDTVPPPVRAVAAAGIALTVVGVVLLLAGFRRPALAGVR